MGVIESANGPIPNIKVENLCRRRLSFLLYKLKYGETVALTSLYISHGRILLI
jgi:ribosomal protein S4